MSINATIIKTSENQWTGKRNPDELITIEADDKDKLFALYFREYDNCYKYCNSVRHSLEDPALSLEYRIWFSDIRNYANNGGDMW